MATTDDTQISLVLVLDYGTMPLTEIETVLAQLPKDLPDARQVVVVTGYRASAVLIAAGLDKG